RHFQNTLQLNCRVKKIAFENRRSLLTLETGETLIADKVFSAISAKQLASLLSETCPILSTCLNNIPSASIAAINLGYHSPVLQQEGFGYLIPSQEKQRLLGVVWDSSAFPQQNVQREQTRLTAMIGGTHFKDFAKYQEDEFIEIALKEIEQQLGIRQTPDYISIQQATAAIPQYSVGHAQNLAKIENAIKQLPGDLTLTGNHFYGISVNDCIAHAKKIVKYLL
ncbi:MAG: protoporphyrinogen oxidase, partial [Parachlamydiaceae bacterium]